MDQGPLVSEQINAGARFLGEFHKYAPVQDGFWLKDSEEGTWYLYVASDQITDENFDVGYGEVLRIAKAIKDPWFDPFQVKLIGTDDVLAKDVAAIRRRYSERTPIHLRDKTIGGTTVDEVYVYPSPLPAPVQS
jgi:hypothetical protein